MTVDVTAVINAVIALISAVVTAFLIPWIRSKTTSQQRESLVAWAKIGVAAAEQIYQGEKRGAEKKQYVLDFLAQNGISFNEESVNAAIEAAVKQLNSDWIVDIS
ncbi:MAG: phage holin family protein [Lachnospiraceae bacterium]|nr:phage holin family protein [Ruminococcus sp.]MCM1277305.1 phage holin family protein [Lachnospiraceae bacterium]